MLILSWLSSLIHPISCQTTELCLFHCAPTISDYWTKIFHWQLRNDSKFVIFGIRQRSFVGDKTTDSEPQSGHGDNNYWKTITCPSHPFTNHISGYSLQVIRPANQRTQVHKGGRNVELVVPELSVLVVPGEHVVVIMPPVAKWSHRNKQILGRVDVPGSK